MKTPVQSGTGAGTPTIAEIRPWREVGWIFHNGTVVAVERQGSRTRVRTPLERHDAAPHAHN